MYRRFSLPVVIDFIAVTSVAAQIAIRYAATPLKMLAFQMFPIV
jgi:hypothetical protein